MKFPKPLLQYNKPTFSASKIHHLTNLYARHKPGSQWKEGDEYPDFDQIRSNQSFNWSAFSLPIWTRFNNRKEYLMDYGVVGYSVYTIKNIHKLDPTIPKSMFGINHKPEPNNYSHCELICKTNVKSHKRAFRMNLKHRCKIHYLPYQKNNFNKNIKDYFIMILHRFIVKVNN